MIFFIKCETLLHSILWSLLKASLYHSYFRLPALKTIAKRYKSFSGQWKQLSLNIRYEQGLEKYVIKKLFSWTFATTPEDLEIDQEISEKIHFLQSFLRPEHLDIPAFLQNEASWLEQCQLTVWKWSHKCDVQIELWYATSVTSQAVFVIAAVLLAEKKLLCIMSCCMIINNLLLNSSMSENQVVGGPNDFLPVLTHVTIKLSPLLSS